MRFILPTTRCDSPHPLEHDHPSHTPTAPSINDLENSTDDDTTKQHFVREAKRHLERMQAPAYQVRQGETPEERLTRWFGEGGDAGNDVATTSPRREGVLSSSTNVELAVHPDPSSSVIAPIKFTSSNTPSPRMSKLFSLQATDTDHTSPVPPSSLTTWSARSIIPQPLLDLASTHPHVATAGIGFATGLALSASFALGRATWRRLFGAKRYQPGMPFYRPGLGLGRADVEARLGGLDIGIQDMERRLWMGLKGSESRLSREVGDVQERLGKLGSNNGYGGGAARYRLPFGTGQQEVPKTSSMQLAREGEIDTDTMETRAVDKQATPSRSSFETLGLPASEASGDDPSSSPVGPRVASSSPLHDRVQAWQAGVDSHLDGDVRTNETVQSTSTTSVRAKDEIKEMLMALVDEREVLSDQRLKRLEEKLDEQNYLLETILLELQGTTSIDVDPALPADVDESGAVIHPPDTEPLQSSSSSVSGGDVSQVAPTDDGTTTPASSILATPSTASSAGTPDADPIYSFESIQAGMKEFRDRYRSEMAAEHGTPAETKGGLSSESEMPSTGDDIVGSSAEEKKETTEAKSDAPASQSVAKDIPEGETPLKSKAFQEHADASARSERPLSTDQGPDPLLSSHRSQAASEAVTQKPRIAVPTETIDVTAQDLANPSFAWSFTILGPFRNSSDVEWSHATISLRQEPRDAVPIWRGKTINRTASNYVAQKSKERIIPVRIWSYPGVSMVVLDGVVWRCVREGNVWILQGRVTS